jgi:hypothetical protein
MMQRRSERGHTAARAHTGSTVAPVKGNQGDTIDATVTYPWKIGVVAFSQGGTLSTHTTLRME